VGIFIVTLLGILTVMATEGLWCGADPSTVRVAASLDRERAGQGRESGRRIPEEMRDYLRAKGVAIPRALPQSGW